MVHSLVIETAHHGDDEMATYTSLADARNAVLTRAETGLSFGPADGMFDGDYRIVKHTAQDAYEVQFATEQSQDPLTIWMGGWHQPAILVEIVGQ